MVSPVSIASHLIIEQATCIDFVGHNAYGKFCVNSIKPVIIEPRVRVDLVGYTALCKSFVNLVMQACDH